jgi:hypothetical protein
MVRDYPGATTERWSRASDGGYIGTNVSLPIHSEYLNQLHYYSRKKREHQHPRRGLITPDTVFYTSTRYIPHSVRLKDTIRLPRHLRRITRGVNTKPPLLVERISPKWSNTRRQIRMCLMVAVEPEICVSTEHSASTNTMMLSWIPYLVARLEHKWHNLFLLELGIRSVGTLTNASLTGRRSSIASAWSKLLSQPNQHPLTLTSSPDEHYASSKSEPHGSSTRRRRSTNSSTWSASTAGEHSHRSAWRRLFHRNSSVSEEEEKVEEA